MMIDQLKTCLKSRLTWYKKASLLRGGVIPPQNGFDFPDGDIPEWQGAIHELQNTLDMLSVLEASQTTDISREQTHGNICKPVMTFDDIKQLSAEGFAEFVCESPEFEFIPCIFCEYNSPAEGCTSTPEECCVNHRFRDAVKKWLNSAVSGYEKPCCCKDCGEKLVVQHPRVAGLFVKTDAFVSRKIPLCNRCFSKALIC